MVELLADMGIPLPEKRANEYPHNYSGGMRQRAMIAMAMSCNPKVLIADAPTTALDVTIQAQIFNLMIKLKQEHNTAIMLITQDMGVIAELADEAAVMYMGNIVEAGTVDDVLRRPQHSYTRALLESIPVLGLTPMSARLGTNLPRAAILPPTCAMYCPQRSTSLTATG